MHVDFHDVCVNLALPLFGIDRPAASRNGILEQGIVLIVQRLATPHGILDQSPLGRTANNLRVVIDRIGLQRDLGQAACGGKITRGQCVFAEPI